MSNELAIEIIVNLLIGVLFSWIGYLIYDKKNYQLIAIYNVLSEELQKRIDIKKLSKNIKIACFSMGILIAVTPSVLKISGYYNWGLSFPLIIGLGFIYSLISFVTSFHWKMDEYRSMQEL